MRRKLPLPATWLGGIVLAVVALALMGTVGNRQNPLFDHGSEVTLYCETTLGVEPEFPMERFFPKDTEGFENLDYGKFSFDLDGCNLNASGVYQIPVYYDGKRTVCTVELTVLGLPETPGDLNFGQQLYGKLEE